jgi:type I restriction enzyme S subunit
MTLYDVAWPVAPLGELVVAKRGLSSYYLREGDVTVPFITLKDLRVGRIVAETVDEILVRNTELLERSRVAPGDVIIAIKGTSFRAAVADESIDGFVISANLIALTPSEKVKPEIIAAYLNSPAGQREMEMRAGGGTIKGLNTKSLLEVPIPIIPLGDQEVLSRYLALAEEYDTILKRELDLCKEIKDAVIFHTMRPSS